MKRHAVFYGFSATLRPAEDRSRTLDYPLSPMRTLQESIRGRWTSMGVRRLGRSTTSSTRSGRTCFRCGRSRCIGHVARRLVARCTSSGCTAMWHGPYVSSVRPLVPHSSRDLPAAFEPDPMRSASPWDLTRVPCRSLVWADRSHRRLVTPGSPAQQVMWGLAHISIGEMC